MTYCPGFGGAPATIMLFNSGNTAEGRKKDLTTFLRAAKFLQDGAQKSRMKERSGKMGSSMQSHWRFNHLSAIINSSAGLVCMEGLRRRSQKAAGKRMTRQSRLL